jgi:hypothetical protein
MKYVLDASLCIFLLSCSYAAICWGYYQWSWRWEEDGGEGDNGIEDTIDPQDWWKRDGGKPFSKV